MTDLRNLVQEFAAAGLLPDQANEYANAELFRDTGDLLPRLLDLANAAELAEAASAIDRAINAGSELRMATDWQRLWLGPRLLLHRMSPRFSRCVGIISSRLGLGLDSKQEWFNSLRTIVVRRVLQRDAFITAATTAGHQYVERCVTLFGGNYSRIHAAADECGLASWLSTQFFAGRAKTTDHPEIGISPPLDSTEELNDEIKTIPQADRSIAAIADQVFVLHIRPGGHIHKLVRAILENQHRPTTVFVHTNERFVPRSLLHPLLDQGAIGWHPLDCDEYRSNATAESTVARRASEGDSESSLACASGYGDGRLSAAAAIVPIPIAESWRYLTHWTRRQRGPWIDQDDDEYLDELIMGSPSRDRSALAALARIVVGKKILGNRSKSSENGRVSFTEVPMVEWHQRRCYRGHRNRWDFESYGICIDRAWLDALGVRRVTYGPPELRDKLPVGDRPFFQVEKSVGKRTGRVIDWTTEREWRHVGDIDLTELSPRDGLVFVPTNDEAEHIRRISPWPVAVLARP